MKFNRNSRSQKIAIYTCIVGNYDVLVPPVNIPNSIRLFCFTDNTDLKVDGWEVLPLAVKSLSYPPGLINRYHKLFPERVLPAKFDCSVYIDGNIGIVGDVRFWVNQYVEKNVQLVRFWHPGRPSVYEEATRCKERGFFNEQQLGLLKQQLQFYKQENLPVTEPLSENTILLRFHDSPRLNQAMELWWQQLNTYTSKDQLSLPYCLWKTECSFQMIEEWTFKATNLYFKKYEHRDKGWRGAIQELSWSNRGFGWVYNSLVLMRRYRAKLKRMIRLRQEIGLKGALQSLRNCYLEACIVNVNVRGYQDHIYYRRTNETDFKLLRKILGAGAGDPGLKLVDGLIIDAGANVGFVTLALAHSYPNCRIIAIEPDKDNFELLKRNTAGLPQVTTVLGALWSKSGTVSIKNPNAASDSFQVSDGDEGVRAFSIRDLMRMADVKFISLLKLDIEGAEYELFRHGSDSWFHTVNSMMVELHERFAPGLEQLFNDLVSSRLHDRRTHDEYEVVEFKD